MMQKTFNLKLVIDMKKLTFTIIAILIVGFKATISAQSPVYFPDGLVVGPVELVLPNTSAQYKLAVAGGIITEKVRVATNGTAFWADFVFDKSYKLKPLAELEQYIKLNKHLPDMPTTADVNKDGLDLATTQALLLQKIEELTLYTIEQNKKIEKLERKLNAVNYRTRKIR